MVYTRVLQYKQNMPTHLLLSPSVSWVFLSFPLPQKGLIPTLGSVVCVSAGTNGRGDCERSGGRGHGLSEGWGHERSEGRGHGESGAPRNERSEAQAHGSEGGVSFHQNLVDYEREREREREGGGEGEREGGEGERERGGEGETEER